MGGLRWPGTVAIIIVVFAALWETKDHNVPATKEEWQELLYYWVSPSDEVIAYLVTLRATLQDVIRSAGPFLVAVGQLIYLTARPLAMGLYLLLSKAGRGFYEYVIVRFVASPTTIRHVRYGVSTAIAWQMARTKREVAMEVAGIASLISLYLLLRFLNRQRYLDRSKAYVRRQRRKLQMRYQAFLQNLAVVNRKLAIMTPHAIFWTVVGLFECLFFSFGRRLLESVPATWALDTALPLIWTIQLLMLLWEESRQEKLDDDSSSSGRRGGGKKSKKLSSQQKARHRRTSICGIMDEKHYIRRIHQQDLLNYWVVRGTVAAAKIVIGLLPFATKFLLAKQGLLFCILSKAEFYFWLWVNLIRYLTPAFVARMSMNPIDWLADHVIRPVAVDLQKGLSLDFPQVIAFWQTTVIFFSSNFLSVMVMTRALTKERADTLNHLTAEARRVVLPLLLVMVYPLRLLGVVCVSHVLPIAGSLRAALTPTDESPRTVAHWLQTWVIHVLVSGLLRLLAPVLFFVPFSNVLILCVFALLSLAPPPVIEAIYQKYVQEELQIWHVLDPGDIAEQPGKESYVAKLVDCCLKYIPRSEDAVEMPQLTNRTGVNGGGAGGGDGGGGGGQRDHALKDANGVVDVAPLQPVEHNLVDDEDKQHGAEKENDYPARNLRQRRRATRG